MASNPKPAITGSQIVSSMNRLLVGDAKDFASGVPQLGNCVEVLFPAAFTNEMPLRFGTVDFGQVAIHIVQIAICRAMRVIGAVSCFRRNQLPTHRFRFV